MVLYNQTFQKIKDLIENIADFERLAIENNIEVNLLILDNSKYKLNFNFNEFGFIKYIFNNKNIGFGRGHNKNLFSMNFRPNDVY